MARVNKERLAVLLGEIERKEGGDERYAASLECVLFREGQEMPVLLHPTCCRNTGSGCPIM